MSNNKQLTVLDQTIAREEYLSTLNKGFIFADVFINRPYLDRFTRANILMPKHGINNVPQNIRLFHMTKIVFDRHEDVTDKLISVYNALYNLNVHIGIFIKGSPLDTEIYFATYSKDASLAGDILESSLHGNFPGIALKNFEMQGVSEFQKNFSQDCNGNSVTKGLATVSMIPALRNKERKEQFVQGLEKFINAMRSKIYTAVLLATPVGKDDIILRRQGYEELYSTLSPHAKISYAYGKNLSLAVNKGISRSFTKSVNESVSRSNSHSESNSTSNSYSDSSGSSYSGGGWGFNSSSSSSSSTSYSSGVSFSNSISNSVGTSEGETENEGKTETAGSSTTQTLNYENKSVADLMKKIEEQLKRLSLSESYGLWEYCAYFFSGDISTSMLAATTYKSLMTGENTGVENAHVNTWTSSRNQGAVIETILNHVKNLQHPCANLKLYDDYSQLLVTPTSLVSGNELAILMGMPRKSVSGLVVQEMAEFGRDVFYENKLPKVPISIGNIYHMGTEEKDRPVKMDLNLLASHCFITGSSGSGKSYAIYNLLDRLLSNGIKMLVIEPAKGEYKMVFGNLPNVNIFTTDINSYRLLRINPFQFPDEINVLSHIEQLLQIFNAAWSLYDAMPAILKEAVVSAYVACGWDIKNSIWLNGISKKKYPLFEDVLDALPKIIDASDYSGEVKGNYKGALINRVKDMTMGLSGLIFKGSNRINDKVLFDENTIIDLSEVGSEETVALIMGFLIMRLGEHRRALRKSGYIKGHDNDLSHVTVLEEAHNLLKRTSKEQNQEGSNMVGKSVEMISNSIKEMRTYGEGFLIIDQSPLAVDTSVVENTSTKIVLNIPSKEACEELGSALSLNAEQTRELSRLNVGVAAVMQKGWLMPVLMRVNIWNAQKYEAKLRSENKDMLLVIRSHLVEELVRQINDQKFSIPKMSDIITNCSLSDDRKKELEEVIDLYRSLKRTKGISPENLGRLFLEIIDCENLFEIVKLENFVSVNDFWELMSSTEDEDEQDRIYRERILTAEKWLSKMSCALDQYVFVDQNIKNCSLKYMIYFKGEVGVNEDNIFGGVYSLIRDGLINL